MNILLYSNTKMATLIMLTEIRGVRVYCSAPTAIGNLDGANANGNTLETHRGEAVATLVLERGVGTWYGGTGHPRAAAAAAVAKARQKCTGSLAGWRDMVPVASTGAASTSAKATAKATARPDTSGHCDTLAVSQSESP